MHQNKHLLCIKIKSYVAHMLYDWSFGHITVIPIEFKYNKYYIYLDTYINAFALGCVNSNKNRSYNS